MITEAEIYDKIKESVTNSNDSFHTIGLLTLILRAYKNNPREIEINIFNKDGILELIERINQDADDLRTTAIDIIADKGTVKRINKYLTFSLRLFRNKEYKRKLNEIDYLIKKIERNKEKYRNIKEDLTDEVRVLLESEYGRFLNETDYNEAKTKYFEKSDAESITLYNDAIFEVVNNRAKKRTEFISLKQSKRIQYRIERDKYVLTDTLANIVGYYKNSHPDIDFDAVLTIAKDIIDSEKIDEFIDYIESLLIVVDIESQEKQALKDNYEMGSVGDLDRQELILKGPRLPIKNPNHTPKKDIA